MKAPHLVKRTKTACIAALGIAVAGCGANAESSSSDLGEIGTVSAAATATTPSVDLIAIGTISGSISDRSKATAAPLENGVAGNLLGGLGSGLAHAGGDFFVALPDRGPNAVPYDSALDDTVSYINRFQTFELALRRNAAGAALPFSLTPQLLATTLLWTSDPLVYGNGDPEGGVGPGAPALNRGHVSFFTGRSDNFDPSKLSTDTLDARLDPESIRVSIDGLRVYVSDEYGPYVYEFDRLTGRRLRTFAIPDAFGVANLSPQGAVEISDNTSGRVANKGMEGLALTPDGKTLLGAMQSPLLQDGGTNGRFTRLVKITIATGAVSEYAYELTNIGTAKKPKFPTVSDIVAVNDHEFLVDERDGNGLASDNAAVFKQLNHIDIDGATEVTGISGDANLDGTAIPKTLFLDIVATLNAHGIASTEIPAKLEGVAFGRDVVFGGELVHTLYVSNDNDFLATITDTTHPNGVDNPNHFFVFAVPRSTLPTYVPEPIL